MSAVELTVLDDGRIEQDVSECRPHRCEVDADRAAVVDVAVRRADIRAPRDAVQIDADAVQAADVHDVAVHRDRASDIAIEDQRDAVAQQAVVDRVVRQIDQPQRRRESTHVDPVLTVAVDLGIAPDLQTGNSRDVVQRHVDTIQGVTVRRGCPLTVHQETRQLQVLQIDVDPVQRVVVGRHVGQLHIAQRAAISGHRNTVRTIPVGRDIGDGDILADGVRQSHIHARRRVAGDHGIRNHNGSTAGVERHRHHVVEVGDRVVGRRDRAGPGHIVTGDVDPVLTDGRHAHSADVQLIEQNAIRCRRGHQRIERHKRRLGQTGVQRIVEIQT